ncbi:hypothetical protein BDN70DRAFT_115700 [Pholiota conissans]|uniref:Uncharacterized protein n=1 Tax=Pholiota conissans TaxID=109636 RepID=A0A9P5YZ42_9AGAR|nr:hypothetical protein BDN70DRAFT_115700 [Pholiota conissans]
MLERICERVVLSYLIKQVARIASIDLTPLSLTFIFIVVHPYLTFLIFNVVFLLIRRLSGTYGMLNSFGEI